MSNPEIFLSYRRDDTGGHSRSLFQQLDKRFPERVFLDWEGIRIGENFLSKLEAVGQCAKLLLVLIGKQWLSATDAAGNQRIALVDDVVGKEITLALERGIAVVPVLFDGATMPTEAELPLWLKPLALCNAVTLSNGNYDSDLERLTRGIEEILGEDRAVVIHAVRRENDWTSATAFGKEVSVEFSFTPKRKQIAFIVLGVVLALTSVLLAIALMFMKGG